MATTTHLGLETHGDGTVGLNGIIDANWARLDEIFDPALSNADGSFNAIWRAMVRSATDPTQDGTQMEWDASTSQPVWRESLETIAYAGTYAFDLDGAKCQIMQLNADLTLSLSNQAIGKKQTILLTASGATRTVTYPAWTWLNATPSTIASGKTARIELICRDGTAGGVLAKYDVQP